MHKPDARIENKFDLSYHAFISFLFFMLSLQPQCCSPAIYVYFGHFETLGEVKDLWKFVGQEDGEET